jgi:hypothetical protein
MVQPQGPVQFRAFGDPVKTPTGNTNGYFSSISGKIYDETHLSVFYGVFFTLICQQYLCDVGLG